ncbi:zinc finger protein ZAT11 [Canna indica]|uniref:Zinc finger protein ZAT11 n=1 Tax=Canna indica TaxID=4628 RepID=A0AAQ3K3B8_9LILI|nr:zinc finger protein ZAT11 [Canna indica]
MATLMMLGTPPPPGWVFECKTCNWRFVSFQVLGGHRASHNESKLGVARWWGSGGCKSAPFVGWSLPSGRRWEGTCGSTRTWRSRQGGRRRRRGGSRHW